MKTRVLTDLPHRFLITAAPLAIIASAAFAQEGEHAAPKGEVVAPPEQGIMPAIVTFVVFSIVLAVLATKVWPVIVKGLKDRENKIRDEIESAEMARQQAKDALEQYQKSLADARAEAQKMLDATRAQQAAMAADLKAKADVELQQMRERAMRDIDSAKRAAVTEIYSEAANIGTLIASKILSRTVTASDTKQLVEESMKQLASLKN